MCILFFFVVVIILFMHLLFSIIPALTRHCGITVAFCVSFFVLYLRFKTYYDIYTETLTAVFFRLKAGKSLIFKTRPNIAPVFIFIYAKPGAYLGPDIYHAPRAARLWYELACTHCRRVTKDIFASING